MSLIERLESAEVGSRELDCEVWCIFDGWVGVDKPPCVTTSLDAALALAERVLPEFTATIVKFRTNGGEFKPSSQANLLCIYGEIREYHGHAPTPALALCLAVLKAKSVGE